MEDIVQLIPVFIAIGISIFVAQRKNKRQLMEQTGEEETEESPLIELIEEEVATPVQAKPQRTSRNKRKNHAQQVTPAAEVAAATPSPTRQEVLSDAVKQRLRTPQGAREAFIYSQIFTRKYQ